MEFSLICCIDGCLRASIQLCKVLKGTAGSGNAFKSLCKVAIWFVSAVSCACCNFRDVPLLQSVQGWYKYRKLQQAQTMHSYRCTKFAICCPRSLLCLPCPIGSCLLHLCDLIHCQLLVGFCMVLTMTYIFEGTAVFHNALTSCCNSQGVWVLPATI